MSEFRNLLNEKEINLGKVAYDAYCGSKNINWKSKFTGASLPQFENNLTEIQEAWIECAQTVKQQVLLEII